MGECGSGPWKWVDSDDHRNEDAHWRETGSLVDGDERCLLTTVGCENSGVHVRREDASLIAAAPELLEALKEEHECALFERFGGGNLAGLEKHQANCKTCRLLARLDVVTQP